MGAEEQADGAEDNVPRGGIREQEISRTEFWGV